MTVDVYLSSGQKVDVRLKRKHKTKDVEEKIRSAIGKSSGTPQPRSSKVKRSLGRKGGSDLKRDSAKDESDPSDDCVLFVVLEDGTQKLCEPEDFPLKLLLGESPTTTSKTSKRKLMFLPRTVNTAAVSPRGVLSSSSHVASTNPFAASTLSPPVVAAAYPSLNTSAPSVLMTAEVVAPLNVTVAEVPLTGLLRLNDLYSAASSSYSAAADELARHEWLHQVPVLYDFSLEVRALDAVNASSAKALYRSQFIDESLRKSSVPPPVNRASKPK